MCRAAYGNGKAVAMRLMRLLAVGILGLVWGGCLSGGGRRAEPEAEPSAAAVSEAIVSDLEAMVEGFALHLTIAVRAVENARAARGEAEARRLAAFGQRDRHPDARLRVAERETAAELAEAFALLESMTDRMHAIEARLSSVRALVAEAQAAERRGGLSRRERNRLHRLHTLAQADYNAISAAVVRLKGRWLLPHYEDDEPVPDIP